MTEAVRQVTIKEPGASDLATLATKIIDISEDSLTISAMRQNRSDAYRYVNKQELAEALVPLIPGLTYVKPVTLPTGVGAVVDLAPNKDYPYHRSLNRYTVRQADGSWRWNNGAYEDSDIEAWIRNGGVIVSEGVQS